MNIQKDDRSVYEEKEIVDDFPYFLVGTQFASCGLYHVSQEALVGL